MRGIPKGYRGQYGGISPIDKGPGVAGQGGYRPAQSAAEDLAGGPATCHISLGRGRLRLKGAVGLRHSGWIANRGFRMKSLGRAGQLLGLTLPCLAVVLELMHAISLGQMLVMLVAAVCCFWIGRIIESYGN